MSAGKNKLLRNCRLYLGEYDLSGDSRDFGSLMFSTEPVEITGWDEDMQYVSDASIMMGVDEYEAIVNDDVGRSFDVLKDTQDLFLLSLPIGGGAAPAVGDVAYMLPTVHMSAPIDYSHKAGLISASFMFDYRSIIKNPFGRVLQPKADLTTSVDGTSVNYGAATTDGGWAHLHIFSTSTGSFTFKVQHSTDDAIWSDLITFTLDGSAVGSEFGESAGTVNQYTRFQATWTSGSAIVACFFSRNII